MIWCTSETERCPVCVFYWIWDVCICFQHVFSGERLCTPVLAANMEGELQKLCKLCEVFFYMSIWSCSKNNYRTYYQEWQTQSRSSCICSVASEMSFGIHDCRIKSWNIKMAFVENVILAFLKVFPLRNIDVN